MDCEHCVTVDITYNLCIFIVYTAIVQPARFHMQIKCGHWDSEGLSATHATYLLLFLLDRKRKPTNMSCLVATGYLQGSGQILLGSRDYLNIQLTRIGFLSKDYP